VEKEIRIVDMMGQEKNPHKRTLPKLAPLVNWGVGDTDASCRTRLLLAGNGTLAGSAEPGSGDQVGYLWNWGKLEEGRTWMVLGVHRSRSARR